MIAELTKELASKHDQYQLFGILLFTEANANVVKLLNDRSFYTALDEMTGDHIAIFATVLFPEEMRTPSSAPGITAQMVPVYVEPRKNLELMGWFDIKSRMDLPILGIFAHEKESFLYQKHLIDEASEATAFAALKSVLEPISECLRVDDFDSRADAFRRAKWEMRKVHSKNTVAKLLGLVGAFRGATGV